MTSKPPKLGQIFFVLSDPLRRQVLAAALGQPGATVTEICGKFQVSRFAVMRHLNVLEDNGFIRREIHGRERHVFPTGLRFEKEISAWAENLRRTK
jgi:DNA-binding transcriptional ArsR family regulator